MPDFGTDIAGGVDLTPTLLNDSGQALMLGVVVRRLFTPNGSLLSAPSALTVDLRQFASGDYPQDDRGTRVIESTAAAALKDDERIFTAFVKIRWESAFYLTVKAVGEGADGPFSLTLGVGSVTFSVLSQ